MAPERQQLVLEKKGRLVAAGVVLRGNQDQARTCRLWPGDSAECIEDAEDGSLSCQDTQAHGGDHSKAENKRYEKRTHVQPSL